MGWVAIICEAQKKAFDQDDDHRKEEDGECQFCGGWGLCSWWDESMQCYRTKPCPICQKADYEDLQAVPRKWTAYSDPRCKDYLEDVLKVLWRRELFEARKMARRTWKAMR